jgi:hypothetical protein
MRYRDLTEISEAPNFQELIKYFNLKYILREGVIYIKNKCLLLMIYGFYTEEIIYVDFYDIKSKTISNIERLISENNDEALLKTYKYYKQKHTRPISQKTLNPTTLFAEQYFLIYIEIIKKFLQDIMLCDLNKYSKYFEPAPPMRQQEFEKILKEF